MWLARKKRRWWWGGGHNAIKKKRHISTIGIPKSHRSVSPARKKVLSKAQVQYKLIDLQRYSLKNEYLRLEFIISKNTALIWPLRAHCNRDSLGINNRECAQDDLLP